MSQLDLQKAIWQKIWDQNQSSILGILQSKHTLAAYKSIKRFITIKDKRILEAGCGTGRFCALLGKDFPDSEVTGFDISESSLRIATKIKQFLKVPNVSFCNGNLFSMQYQNESFDVVFNEGVIEHFSFSEKPNYKDALREMLRVTKKGGKVIVAVPNWYCIPHTLYKWVLSQTGRKFKYGYEKSFRHKELVSLFKEFNVKDIELVGFYPAHAFYRLSGYSPFFSFLGRVTDMIKADFFQNTFGFEIIAKGNKE